MTQQSADQQPLPVQWAFVVQRHAAVAVTQGQRTGRICTKGKIMSKIAMLFLSLVLVNPVCASVIGQMQGPFLCDSKATYSQAVDMLLQHNWDAVARLVLSERCVQLSKGNLASVQEVPLLAGSVKLHPHGKTVSWWASTEEVHR
jgi:hypothetical protein